MQLLHANASQHLSGSVLSSQRSRDELFCRASELEPHHSAGLQLNCSASSSKRRSISGTKAVPTMCARAATLVVASALVLCTGRHAPRRAVVYRGEEDIDVDAVAASLQSRGLEPDVVDTDSITAL